ncbi:MAG: 30S ribosomal protein S8 [Candidatus Aureabacteria bacterium]|nr:30S ribosomal protein S8 [Candidatus Auribacterota bacterium]
MGMSDPIADMLTRIRNAYSTKHLKVDIPLSRIKEAILDVLRKEGYISDYIKKTDERKLEVTLKYPSSGSKIFHEIKRISKPGRRVYVKQNEVKPFKGGLGINILSTSKGIMTNREAGKAGLGGEWLCSIW